MSEPSAIGTNSLAIFRESLEHLYAMFNHREFVAPDPLAVLYAYEDPADREVAALVASCVAYGRVGQIMRSARGILERLPAPASLVAGGSDRSLRQRLSGLKHRFTSGEQLAAMLAGARRVIRRYGSLQTCFLAGFSAGEETVVPAMSRFVAELTREAAEVRKFLLPSPTQGSACKRMSLFLRWMVRRDEVDPGGWDGVPASKLVIPLDTHMHRVCRELGLTRRKQADMRTVLEVTAAFRTIAPDDPVRYDFALTRLAMRRDAHWNAFLEQHGVQEAA